MSYNDLRQNEYWITADGARIALADMEPRHRRNTLAFLRRNAMALKFHAQVEMALGPFPRGDAACDAYDDAFDELLRESDQEWLNEQPLVVELRRLVAEDEAAPMGPWGDTLADVAGLLVDSDGLDYWLVQP